MLTQMLQPCDPQVVSEPAKISQNSKNDFNTLEKCALYWTACWEMCIRGLLVCVIKEHNQSRNTLPYVPRPFEMRSNPACRVRVDNAW